MGRDVGEGVPREARLHLIWFVAIYALLCATSVFFVSLWLTNHSNHRDTENTEVAQRNQADARDRGDSINP
jgi:hypothetical protein